MSQVRTDLISEPVEVLDYVLGDLKKIIENITPIHKIYITGSRSKFRNDNCVDLTGKDWDIIVVARNRIINTKVWTVEQGYHIDLMIRSEDSFDLSRQPHCVELFPIRSFT
jgi:predicted nucleotidyltransferase